jgi:hypothetical protein
MSEIAIREKMNEMEQEDDLDQQDKIVLENLNTNSS